jgi:hypothetical protein
VVGLAASEARIALDNLRVAARAFADAIADARPPEGAELRAEMALLRRADVPNVDGDTTKALTSVTHAASELLRQARSLAAERPRVSLASRRLEAELSIAAAVLRAIANDTVSNSLTADGDAATPRKAGG